MPSANVPSSAWHQARKARESTAGREHLTEALAALRPVEGRHGLPEAVDRPTIVALGMVGDAEVVVRQRLQDDIPTGRGERQGALGGGDGLVIRAHEEKWFDRKRETCPSRRGSSRAVGEGLGLAQLRQDAPKVARRQERRAQGEPEIDGLLARVARLRQMREGR